MSETDPITTLSRHRRLGRFTSVDEARVCEVGRSVISSRVEPYQALYPSANLRPSTMQEIEQRHATEADLPFIRDVLAQNDLPVADLEENLDAFYLFESGANTVGVGAVQPTDGNALLRSVVILEIHRGSGYGTRCCERLLQIADEQGLDRLYLLTTGAAEFFSKLGFTEVERSQVPPAIRETRQFSELCPATATCMQFSL